MFVFRDCRFSGSNIQDFMERLTTDLPEGWRYVAPPGAGPSEERTHLALDRAAQDSFPPVHVLFSIDGAEAKIDAILTENAPPLDTQRYSEVIDELLAFAEPIAADARIDISVDPLEVPFSERVGDDVAKLLRYDDTLADFPAFEDFAIAAYRKSVRLTGDELAEHLSRLEIDDIGRIEAVAYGRLFDRQLALLAKYDKAVALEQAGTGG